MVLDGLPTPLSYRASDVRKQRIREALLKFAEETFQSSSESCDGPSNGKLRQVASRLPTAVVAPISPTPPFVISLIVPKLNLNRDSTVVDLGCGDGRWILAAYKEYGCRCIGCDIDDARLCLASRQIDSVLQSKSIPPSEDMRIKVVKRDVFEFLKGSEGKKEDSPLLLDVVDVLIVYLFRKAMHQIVDILKDHGIVPLRRGEMVGEDNPRSIISIVSVGFTLPSYMPLWQDQFEGIRIYLYQAKRLGAT